VRTDDFDYELPEDLVAQEPPVRREDARLLVLGRATGAVSHRRITDLPELLRPGDLLVVNDTRVLPARLFAKCSCSRRRPKRPARGRRSSARAGRFVTAKR
jgi:S-adenosylmethionine:tRNA ribosyltransferase-isomerase